MPDTPNPAPEALALFLSDLDAESRDRVDALVEAVRTAYAAIGRSKLEIGRHLMDLCNQGVFGDRNSLFASFVESAFEFSADYGHKCIRLARLDVILSEADVETLTVESHAREVTPLVSRTLESPSGEQSEAAVRAVVRGRQLAEAEGVPPVARHFRAGRQEVAPRPNAEDTPGTDAAADADPAVDQDDIRDAIAELDALAEPTGETGGDGFHVIIGGAVSPWADDIEYPVDHVTPASLSPVRIDAAAGLAYPVLIPGPRETATTWEPTEGPFHATYRPDRIGTPAPADAETSPHDRVVLVAPGVEILHNDVPDRVLDEVTAAVGSDPSRVYLVRTTNVDRAAAREWPANVSVVVEARTADALTELSAQVRAAGSETKWTLLVRDLAAPSTGGFEDSLDVFSWVLVRGKDTSWQTLSALYDAVPRETLHVGKEVRARPEYSPLVADLTAPEVTERADRAPVGVRGARRRAGSPALPPTHSADSPSR